LGFAALSANLHTAAANWVEGSQLAAPSSDP
jgi:hypothetical protein